MFTRAYILCHSLGLFGRVCVREGVRVDIDCVRVTDSCPYKLNGSAILIE